jgi:rubrerythrin
LKEGERIVTSGQFLLDSESQLREAVQKMLNPQKVEATESHDKTNVDEHANATSEAAEARVKYICPMPEHVSIEYDHPGKCPICGMALVPVSQRTLRKLQPGGKLLYYTCPMPEHSDVHASKPGNCPKCGMTLIPVMEAPPLPKTSSTNATSRMEMPAHQH